MTIYSFKMTEKQANLLHNLVDSEIFAHKNWVLSAVESDDLDRAKELTAKIRDELQPLYKLLNMPAHHNIAEISGNKIAEEFGPFYR